MSEDSGRPATDSHPATDSRSANDSRPATPGQLPFTGVVLAGGHSRRFGEANKALAVLDGATFVERVVDAVYAVAGDPLIVAVNSDDQRATIETGLESAVEPTFAYDATSFGGPLAGLYGSLPAVDGEWLFLTGCDMPRLSAPAIAWLADRLRESGSSPDALVPVRTDGAREPLHAFYRREAVADVRSQLQSDASLRTLLDELSETRTVPLSTAPPDVSFSASVENVNTKREYRRVRRTVER